MEAWRLSNLHLIELWKGKIVSFFYLIYDASILKIPFGVFSMFVFAI